MSVDNIASLKKLKREDSTIMDILPMTGNLISDDPNNAIQFDRIKKNPYLGVIFAFDGPAIPTMRKYIENKCPHVNRNLLFDILVCYKKEYIVIRATGTSISPFGLESFERYEVIKTDKDTLPLLFLYLNTCLNTIRLKTPNYGKYWSSVFNETLTKYN